MVRFLNRRIFTAANLLNRANHDLRPPIVVAGNTCLLEYLHSCRLTHDNGVPTSHLPVSIFPQDFALLWSEQIAECPTHPLDFFPFAASQPKLSVVA
jgi:hypothetical protein